MIIIPRKEVPADIQFFKGELTSNAWLNKAASLASKKKRILQDPSISDEEIVQRIKPLDHKLQRATKRLRQIPASGAVEEPEPDDLTTTKLEKWLQRLAKNMEQPKGLVPPAPPPPPIRQQQPAGAGSAARGRGRGRGRGTPVTPGGAAKYTTGAEADPILELTPPETPKTSSKMKTWFGAALEGAAEGIHGLFTPSKGIKPKNNNNNFILSNIYMIVFTVSYLSQLKVELGKAGTNSKITNIQVKLVKSIRQIIRYRLI